MSNYENVAAWNLFSFAHSGTLDFRVRNVYIGTSVINCITFQIVK